MPTWGSGRRRRRCLLCHACQTRPFDRECSLRPTLERTPAAWAWFQRACAASCNACMAQRLGLQAEHRAADASLIIDRDAYQ